MYSPILLSVLLACPDGLTLFNPQKTVKSDACKYYWFQTKERQGDDLTDIYFSLISAGKPYVYDCLIKIIQFLFT